MNYLLLICSDGVPTADKGATMRRELPAWVQDTGDRGVRVYGEQLARPDVAKTVRVRDGAVVAIDEPRAQRCAVLIERNDRRALAGEPD